MVSRNGVLRTRIVVERRKVNVAGRMLWALTYNGRYMPPTLRVRPGDQVEADLVNKVQPYTNLHWHGLHVSPAPHADNVLIKIPAGRTYHYSFRFTKNLKPGTYWYHSHADPISAPQVAGGMAGIIIVDGQRQYLPPALKNITEHVIGLKDFQVQGDSIKTKDLHISAPTNRTVNGQLNPTIRIRPGETQLWRLANISANIYYRLRLRGQQFRVIGQDGFPVDHPYTADTLLLAAAARFDVLVTGGPAGRTVLETLPYNTGPAGNQFPQVNLAAVVSAGTPVPAVALPSTFAPPEEDLADVPVDVHRTIVFSENTAGTKYFINGKQFDPKRVDIRSKLNTVEEWTVRNDTGEEHSFHVHTNHFQLMSINGRPQHFYGRQDTVSVPANGTIVVRLRPTDFTGKTVFHCHILNHEDAGMMAVQEIVK
ncbi:multicopper oxidase family protein [Streptacidiphilus griseoplanus]|uniref:multicopper oxidase family protein n=1 Tax=Peterkaempfera griseoplana TaxID=66896 RepID=UPI000A9F16FB|nr:multicopper oxidase family protein [Peterkaempfera griseoplana]